MTVELIDHMGSDLRVLEAAKVSLNKRPDELDEAGKGVIRYMLREHHASPFEHVVFTFRVKTSIKVAREWFRHRTDSFNEVSTRYVDVSDEFYTPIDGEVRAQVGKPGRYTFASVFDPDASNQVRREMMASYRQAFAAYQLLMRQGVARELASFVLPLGLLTEFIWTVKLRHALHFLALRTSPAALLEIRNEAELVETYVRGLCPVSWAAWNEYGRPLLDSDWE